MHLYIFFIHIITISFVNKQGIFFDSAPLLYCTLLNQPCTLQFSRTTELVNIFTIISSLGTYYWVESWRNYLLLLFPSLLVPCFPWSILIMNWKNMKFQQWMHWWVFWFCNALHVHVYLYKHLLSRLFLPVKLFLY